MKSSAAVLLVCLATSCGEKQYTQDECKALADPKAVIDRCMGGGHGSYVGDLNCWPFSKPERMHGIWVINLETSAFFRDASSYGKPAGKPMWLQTNLLEKNQAIRDAGGGAGRRVYAVDLLGRESLCNGWFGHFGMSPKEVIVERFYSMKLLPGL